VNGNSNKPQNQISKGGGQMVVSHPANATRKGELRCCVTRYSVFRSLILRLLITRLLTTSRYPHQD
jgi:hypothetical protein